MRFLLPELLQTSVLLLLKWGYKPVTGERYDEDERFTGVLARELGEDYRVVEEGLVGRTTVFSDRMEPERCGIEHLLPFILSQLPLDYMVIMLGTNDSKARFGCSSYLIALGITRLVKKALRTECWRDNAHPDVLVIVPPSITPEYDKLKFREEMGPGCHERCAGIAAQLEPMLKDLPGVRFLDANLLPGAGCSPVDGMHLTPEAHKAVAEALKNALTGVTLL